MKDRDGFLFELDEDIMTNELYGVKQLFENGGLYPDTRSRWIYVKYQVKTVKELIRYGKCRVETVINMLTERHPANATVLSPVAWPQEEMMIRFIFESMSIKNCVFFRP